MATAGLANNFRTTHAHAIVSNQFDCVAISHVGKAWPTDKARNMRFVFGVTFKYYGAAGGAGVITCAIILQQITGAGVFSALLAQHVILLGR